MRIKTEFWQYGKVVSSSESPVDPGTETITVTVRLDLDGTVALNVSGTIKAAASIAEITKAGG